MSNANLADPVRTARVMAVKILLAACLLMPGAARAGAETPSAAGPGGVQVRQQGAPAHLVMENVGQYAGEARFLLKQGDRHIWLTGDALWLTIPDAVAADNQAAQPGHRRPAAVARSGTAIRFTFPGANPAATLEPYGRVPTHVSYLTGSDPALWHRDIPVWSGVRYRDLYPGVDLVIGGAAAGAVPWRLEARPGADLGAVTLAAEGAEAVTAAAGRLRLQMKGREVDVALPRWSLTGRDGLLDSAAAQQQAGDGTFAISPSSEGQAGLAAAADAPEGVDAGDLIYSTTLGGLDTDTAYGIAVDTLGNTYITGQTRSDDFPVTAGSFDMTNNGADELAEAFVVKLNAAGDGSALVYATYLGGSGPDMGLGIAVDGGLATVVGETDSTDFPGAPKAVSDGSDIFVTALNADGSDLRFVSRLGGDGIDSGAGIAVDGTNTYIAGSSSSTSLPLAATCGSGADTNLVVAKLSPSGAPVYTTCLGGSTADEEGYGIAVRSGIAYVTGQSYSGSSGDILVAWLSTTGTPTSALIGKAASEEGRGIAVDGSGNIYVAGIASALNLDPYSPSNFPVTGGTPPYGGGASDAVIIKLTSALAPVFATFLGGNDEDYAYALAMDTVQGLYVAGGTRSADFPVTTGAMHGGEVDAFVARMHLSSGASNKVTYATYLGDANDDWGLGVATDTGGHAFVAGRTAASWDSTIIDALVAKQKVSNPPAAPAITITRSGASAKLDWPNTAARYQVFRSSRPYFIPGDWSSLVVKDDTANSYLDTGALDVVDARFYVVKAVDATPAASANSKRVGKFTYQLTPGLN